MNILDAVFSLRKSNIPADVDETAKAREHEIVMRLSKGNVRLQYGMYATEQEVARRKANILGYKFS